MKTLILAMFTIIIIASSMTVGNAHATSISATFVSSFGNTDTGNGQLAIPQGIALDQSGNVYVADQMHNRVAKFDSTGNFITQIGADRLSTPINVAVDESGNVYVLNMNGIEKFNSTGNFVSKFGAYGMNEAKQKEPQGIAVDEAGNVYITDFSNIAKYDSTGNFVSKFGTWGMKDGQLNSTGYMTIDNSGNIYVADGNERVEKFSSDGTFLAKWGSYCSVNDYHTSAIYCHDPDGPGPLNIGDGQFANLEGIALDKFGNVFVTDMGNSRVQVFDPSGNFLYKFGSFGTDGGQFANPNGIALDNSGNLYVVDQNNARVQIFHIDYNSVASSSNDTPSSTPTTATTSIFSSSNPSTFGQPTTFTATITPSSATETVQFAIDGTDVGSPVTISNDAATLPNISNLSVGSHTITATYSGDTNILASTATYTQIVNPTAIAAGAKTSISTAATPPTAVTTPPIAAAPSTTIQSVIPQSTTAPLTSVPTLSSVQKIPNWAKNVFSYYGQGQISDGELISAINFLIQQGIIELK
ncbi:MAG: Ig-like domain repeat protein [Thaumarchaeota archaeon]|nr:Ig-like domain repeat protein [Nitrososphaerota archaeon]